MNSISSGITASSILKNTATTAPAAKENSASIDTNDTLQKSESSKELTKADFVKMNDSSKKGAIIGASIGGVAGGLAGGIIAYNMSMNTVKANNDINSVSLDWQQPVMKSENLGSIPANYYQPANIFGVINAIQGNHGSVDVYRENPVMQNGKPVMQDVSKTFTDYGTPVVSWDTKNIQQSKLAGHHESVYTDVHTEQIYEGKTADGREIYSTREEVKGYQHSFSPDIKNLTVGNYQVPKVKFETGVNVGLNTTLGVLAGAGVGALAGGIAGAAIAKAMNS